MIDPAHRTALAGITAAFEAYQRLDDHLRHPSDVLLREAGVRSVATVAILLLHLLDEDGYDVAELLATAGLALADDQEVSR